MNKILSIYKKDRRIIICLLGKKISFRNYYLFLKDLFKNINEIKDNVAEIKGYAAYIKDNVTEIKGYAAYIKDNVTEIKGYATYIKDNVTETRNIAKGFWNIEFFKKFGIRVPIENAWLGQNFEIIEIALKDIKFGDAKRTPLEEMPAYIALKKNDMEIYRKWISQFTTNKMAENFAVENYINLFNSIKENGYKPGESIIVLTKDNAVADGHHRCCCLLFLFGKDKIITALRAI